MTLVLLRQGTLLLLHQLISTASIQTPGSEVPWLNSPILQSCITWVLPIDSHCQRQVSSLLEEYSDHLVGDICFQLRFEISDLDSTDSCNSKLPLLLAAVVQHASATLRLSGRVGALFHLFIFCDGSRNMPNEVCWFRWPCPRFVSSRSVEAPFFLPVDCNYSSFSPSVWLFLCLVPCLFILFHFVPFCFLVCQFVRPFYSAMCLRCLRFGDGSILCRCGPYTDDGSICEIQRKKGEYWQWNLRKASLGSTLPCWHRSKVSLVDLPGTF